MRELTSQSLASIREVIQGLNYGILKGRLDQLLPRDAARSFAKVNLQSKDGIWYTEDNSKYAPYSEASALDKEYIAIRLEGLKEVASDKLREAMPYWEKLFIVPEQDCIYWAKSEDGAINIVITQWGFEKRIIEVQPNVISDIITAPRPLTQIPVILHCSFSNGDVAANYEFNLDIFNNKRLCKTNPEGGYSLGILFPGKKFTVESTDGLQKFDFIVSSDAEYHAVFRISTDYTLTVLNQNDRPVSDYALTVDGIPILTDSNGRYRFKEYVLNPESIIKVERNGKQLATFEISADEEKNNFVIHVEENIETPKPPELSKPPVTPEKITIKLRGYKGEVLPEMPFKIRNAKGEILSGVTDKNGDAVVEASKFTPGEMYNISFDMSAKYQRRIHNARKEEKR